MNYSPDFNYVMADDLHNMTNTSTSSNGLRNNNIGTSNSPLAGPAGPAGPAGLASGRLGREEDAVT
jgi:hypothetical protein